MNYGDLDTALVRAGELRDELNSINLPGLDSEQLPLVADAVDMTVAVISRIEAAIAIDDRLHPEV